MLIKKCWKIESGCNQQLSLFSIFICFNIYIIRRNKAKVIYIIDIEPSRLKWTYYSLYIFHWPIWDNLFKTSPISYATNLLIRICLMDRDIYIKRTYAHLSIWRPATELPLDDLNFIYWIIRSKAVVMRQNIE